MEYTSSRVINMSISPREDIILCYWIDQGAFGFEVIAISSDHDSQIAELQHESFGCPSFNLDGRYIVYSWQDDWEWLRHITTWNKIHTMGFITILDLDTRQSCDIEIKDQFPQGWKPERNFAPLGTPRFIDDYHVSVALPTGVVHTYTNPFAK